MPIRRASLPVSLPAAASTSHVASLVVPRRCPYLFLPLGTALCPRDPPSLLRNRPNRRRETSSCVSFVGDPSKASQGGSIPPPDPLRHTAKRPARLGKRWFRRGRWDARPEASPNRRGPSVAAIDPFAVHLSIVLTNGPYGPSVLDQRPWMDRMDSGLWTVLVVRGWCWQNDVRDVPRSDSTAAVGATRRRTWSAKHATWRC